MEKKSKKIPVRKKVKGKAGRPEAIIDWNKVDYYLKCQCTTTGIAALLGITADTLYRRCLLDKKKEYSAYSQEKKEHGKELLRSKQYQLAIDGNVPMNIWLGKQYLEQKDKQETDHKNTDGSLKQTSIIVTTNEAKEELKKLMDG